MKCTYDKERLTLLLMDTLTEKERAEIENHLSGCADCQMELKAYKKVWSLMNETPAPAVADTVRTNFNEMLAGFKEVAAASHKSMPSFSDTIRKLFGLQYRHNFAYTLLLFAAGLVGGWLLRSPSSSATASYNKQIDSLSSQMYEMKQLMMLSLLQNPSAMQRIQAVAYTDEMTTVDKKVINALLATLNEDPNVNVRLITLEALTKLAADPVVREGLVKSIVLQDSPLLQSAIADTMLKLREKKSVQSLKQLLDKKDLNEMVRLKIEQTIHKLI